MPDRPLQVAIATDCGSTTTKAILIEQVDGVYRQTCRGEAPTTVEAPFEDVTRGVLNSIQEVEELSRRTILDGERIITPAEGERGVDIYVSTSSAGGGLQMMVAGVVKSMTGESAQRCALGAGAIVMDVLASNDGRLPHEKIERMRRLRPDMILLSGGTDGGTISHVVQMAEFIAAADPRPRFGSTYSLPVIYAGNSDARDEVSRILAEKTALVVTDNLRPVLERENLGPARTKIHDLFLEHVMAQAPGYGKLMTWTGAPIMPTPGAVGLIIENISRRQEINVIGVDIGGATTDVFSCFDGTFNRTVSANLGMSYSVSNVLAEAGIDNVLRWARTDVGDETLRDRVKNKMIRPTTIPQLLEDLELEQALAREALRLAFDQHKMLATGLKGVQRERTISDAFEQSGPGESLISMMNLDLLVGSGGVLSHAPSRTQSMIMMIDAFQPEGVTRLAVDSIFMMPHLGVLSQVNERAAVEVFDHDCMIYLGSCIAPVGAGRHGDRCFRYRVEGPEPAEGEIRVGELRMLPVADGVQADIDITPARGFDAGEGRGRVVHRRIHGGVVGVVLDGRGRPIQHGADPARRREWLNEWLAAVEMYPR